MQSCLYEGTVIHERHSPVYHRFRYRLFLVYLDLSELESVFRNRWLWSTNRYAVARFHRADHLGDPKTPLETSVRQCIHDHDGTTFNGPIRLLTHLRYFGYVFNPISLYFCHDESEQLLHVVAEVNNTPWGERHCYVLDQKQLRSDGEIRTEKAFHVSPFMPMHISYRWKITEPADDLRVGIECDRGEGAFFNVHMELQRREINTLNLAKALVRYPWMTAQVMAAIYWQALRLWWKGCPFIPHPRRGSQRPERTTKPA